MGTLFRRGSLAKWYGSYVDADGKRRQAVLSTDKRLAQQMLAKLERDVERRKAGVSDRYTDAASVPLVTHLAAYRQELESRNSSPAYVAYVERRCRQILDACGFKRISDVTPEAVGHWLKRQRESRKHFGIEISNGYVTVIKGFVRWLWTTGRCVEHRLIGLRKLNADADRRHQRRALSDAELRRLLETTKLSRFVGKNKTTGIDRYSVYLTAAFTGLRAGELRSLRCRDVDFEQLTISVKASSTKNGQAAMLPMHPALAILCEATKPHTPDPVPASQARRYGAPASQFGGMKVQPFTNCLPTGSPFLSGRFGVS